MNAAAVLVIAAAIFPWGVLSARLDRADLSGPIVFAAVGAVLATACVVDAPTALETADRC